MDKLTEEQRKRLKETVAKAARWAKKYKPVIILRNLSRKEKTDEQTEARV